MIKNINDVITIGILVLISAYLIRIFVGTLTPHRNDDTPRQKRRQMVKEYVDNTEE